MTKIRADELLYKQGLCPSRSAAQNLIKQGQVYLEGHTAVRKPGQMLAADTRLQLEASHTYVSRGAWKLLAALEAFSPSVEGKVALDLGSSTGGFTQVLLERGARRVYAVDVGTDQLHASLKNDPRVISLEQTNARQLNTILIPESIQFLTGDLSFISLTIVLPVCLPLLAPNFTAILLIKPQFEAGREQLGSGGVVRSAEIRQQCVNKIIQFAESELGWQHHQTIPSPILGPNGNQEFLALFTERHRPVPTTIQ